MKYTHKHFSCEIDPLLIVYYHCRGDSSKTTCHNFFLNYLFRCLPLFDNLKSVTRAFLSSMYRSAPIFRGSEPYRSIIKGKFSLIASNSSPIPLHQSTACCNSSPSRQVHRMTLSPLVLDTFRYSIRSVFGSPIYGYLPQCNVPSKVYCVYTQNNHLLSLKIIPVPYIEQGYKYYYFSKSFCSS